MTGDALCSQLDEAVRSLKESGYRFMIGISWLFRQLAERTLHAGQASHALELTFFSGYGSVVVFPKAPAPEKKEALLHAGTLKEYLSALENLDKPLASQKYDELFPESLDQTYHPQRKRDSMFQWQSSVLLLLDEWGMSLDEKLLPSSNFEQIAKLHTYGELRDWCARLYTVSFEMLSDRKKVRYRDEIERSIRFIRLHYQKPLRVQDVACDVNLSENYFSYLFAKNTGKTFVHFLQETRIEKAKELLRIGEDYWFTVGEEVGFENPKYFSRIFKKYTNLTPAQYKNSKCLQL
jgi:two-component system response regulator YesN